MVDDALGDRERRRAERAAERSKRVAEGGLHLVPTAVTVLDGGFDGVSLPVESSPGVEAFVQSDRNGWLFPVGSGKTFGAEGSLPRRLNTPGWIFLRSDHELRARVRFLGVERRQVRLEHIASDDGVFHDRGPGFVLAVDASSWTVLTQPIPLSAAEQGNGYRYYDVSADGSSVTFRMVE